MEDPRTRELARELGDPELAELLTGARGHLTTVPADTARRHLDAIVAAADGIATGRAADQADVALRWASRLAATAAGLIVLVGGLATTGGLPASAQEFIAGTAAKVGITLPAPVFDGDQNGPDGTPAPASISPSEGDPGSSRETAGPGRPDTPGLGDDAAPSPEREQTDHGPPDAQTDAQTRAPRSDLGTGAPTPDGPELTRRPADDAFDDPGDPPDGRSSATEPPRGARDSAPGRTGTAPPEPGQAPGQTKAPTAGFEDVDAMETDDGDEDDGEDGA